MTRKSRRPCLDCRLCTPNFQAISSIVSKNTRSWIPDKKESQEFVPFIDEAALTFKDELDADDGVDDDADANAATPDEDDNDAASEEELLVLSWASAISARASWMR